MPVFALYNFNDASAVLDDALSNGAQNGIYLNGATAAGGDLVLDGINDIAKIYGNPTFQLDRGTLEINFTPTGENLNGPQTVLSRDSVGENQGSYRIDVHPDGSVTVTHELEGSSSTITTGPGFYQPGDTIQLSYSWDQGGTGGELHIDNQTSGGSFSADVPPSVTMDMADQSQPWIVGAGQNLSNPDQYNDINQHFQGTVEYFSLSDTVDNVGNDDPDANPDTASTPEDTPVDIPVLDNDTDPNSDPISVTGTPTATNGTVTVNPDGSLRYTPNPNYNGPDTITYTITDPDGNTSTSTVTVTVTPVNDAPNANNDTSTTPLNTAVTFAVLGNDTDVDGDSLSFVGTPTSTNGTVTVNPNGTLTFTPNTGYTGPAVVTYTVTDPDGLTDTATWTITVGDGPDRDGIVRGTAGGDLINVDYIDPFDADRVDANDAIIPGDAPNDDRIIAGGGNDTVLAGPGDDTVWGGDGNDSVTAGDGNDDLRGNRGDDTLLGGSGNDTVYGQQGVDVIDTSGGAPLPDIDYPGVYPADLLPNNDRDLVYGGLGGDTIRTGDDADTIYGDDGRDVIDGGIDADLIYAGQGGDTVVGSEGADTIDGGMGDDLIYGGLNDVIGDALDIADVDGDLRPDNNRDLVYGGTGDDTIFGRDDDDTMQGGDGNDLINGGVDDDVSLGDGGNDTILGGEGNDVSRGGADRDMFVVGSQGNGVGDFIDGNEEGNDFDTLDLTGAGPLTIVYDPTNPENGTVTFRDAAGNPTGTLEFINIENVIPCFTPGTMIATPRGEVPVETLKAGDKVITRDNGIQEIRWIGQKALSGQDLRLNSHLQPILVKAHSLGNGLPEQDMVVSPNHRLLVANDRTQLYFDEHEVLVAAKHMVGTAGIHAINSIGVTYVHFMCDRHEVVLSNGAWTESFQPGDYTLKGMGNSQRNEIFELFPELKTQDGLDGYQAARRTLKRHEAKLLAR